MKRTGFKPKPIAPRSKPPLTPIRQIAIESTARTSVPIPKTAYTRSPELLKACRTIPCQHCGTSDGTIVAAHSNWSEHGKGRSIKASDQFVAALCYACHSELDQGPFLSAQGRKAMWQAAHEKTVARLRELGRWPEDVPVPENNC